MPDLAELRKLLATAECYAAQPASPDDYTTWRWSVAFTMKGRNSISGVDTLLRQTLTALLDVAEAGAFIYGATPPENAVCAAARETAITTVLGPALARLEEER